MSNESYSTIREILSDFLGVKIVDITQHDEDDFRESGESKVYLHCDNGKTLVFTIETEFEILEN